MTKQILILAGDGIGPEICLATEQVINYLNRTNHTDFVVNHRLIGGCSYDEHGEPLVAETLQMARRADAVLLGSVGGTKWDGVERHLRPEAGLLKLRKELDLFANLRPAMSFEALLDSSTLKPEVMRGVDIMIVRELTSGVYFGQPRGMQSYQGLQRCVDTQSYTEAEVTRVAEVAFDLAKKRSGKIHSVEKSNVMETGLFWRKIVTDMGKDYPDIQLQHMYADNCAMQLVREPRQFDVILTDNLFGDMLSDTAAMCTGSLGMLPSASLGGFDNGKRIGLYEPIHGSAPDIAGKNIANPCATILSFAMMLRYSFDMGKLAEAVETAIANVLSKNIRTSDIMFAGAKQVGTDEMGAEVVSELENILR